MATNELVAVAQQFTQAPVLEVREHGSGNLNDTFLATVEGEEPFILQRINTYVFGRPELIMRNMRTFSEHVLARLEREPLERRWVVPRVYAAYDGQDYYLDGQGAFWRAIGFVSHSRCYQTVQNVAHAREAGYALGMFHHLISDLDPARLHDTLEGFHVTPGYLDHYHRVLAQADTGVSGDTPASVQVRYGLQIVAERQGWASILEDARARGELRLRPIHGDPKINNFMIDETTGQAISLIDLDTVKPGLVHYDIGDCLRSCCNSLGEETERIDEVRFDTGLCQAILEGYLSVAAGFLDAHDMAYLYDAIRLIAFELGLRFFTDYLEGDVYFKVKHRENNLWRALVQFKLTESIESQEAEIRAIITGLCDGT
jgi:Ser/Thr protein kinase RdoA (MazF antagonist)